MDESILKFRLRNLKDLTDGWYDSKLGYKFSFADLNWIESKILRFSQNLPETYVYPTLEKNVIIFEWTVLKTEISLEVNLNTRVGFLFLCYNINTKFESDYSIQLDLTLDSSWNLLLTKIKEIKNVKTICK